MIDLEMKLELTSAGRRFYVNHSFGFN